METEKKLKKQQRPRRSFTDEFKAGAVRLVLEEGKNVTQVSKDLDLTQSSLGKWVEQARANKGQSTRGTLTSDEKAELAQRNRPTKAVLSRRHRYGRVGRGGSARCVSMTAARSENETPSLDVPRRYGPSSPVSGGLSHS